MGRLQQGLIYNDFDEDLFNRRVEAKKLFRAYNKTEDNEIELGIVKCHFEAVAGRKAGTGK